MPYVYRHIRLDKNVPFYIGIATFLKRAKAKDGRNKLWKKIVNKTAYEVEILTDNISWLEAVEKEKEFIALYKRINDGGTLANMTLGGEGTIGLCGELNAKFGKKLSDETKRKISESQKGKKISADAKLKMSLAKKYGNVDYTAFRKRQKEVVCKKVIQYTIEGEFIQEFLSISDAAIATKCDTSSISKACKGKLYQCGGYIWEYTDS